MNGHGHWINCLKERAKGCERLLKLLWKREEILAWREVSLHQKKVVELWDRRKRSDEVPLVDNPVKKLEKTVEYPVQDVVKPPQPADAPSWGALLLMMLIVCFLATIHQHDSLTWFM